MSSTTTVIPINVRGRDYKIATRFRDSGADLILFVHGLGCSKQVWRPAWARIELRDKSLFAFDLPGFGQSPPPNDFSYDLQRQAEILAALMDSHAGRRIHLVAHSMGGSLATLLPPRRIARLTSMVLVEPRLFLSSCGIAPEAAEATFDTFRDSVFSRIKRRLASDPGGNFDLDRSDVRAFHASSRSLVEWADRPEPLQSFQSADCRKLLMLGADNRHLAEANAVERDIVRFIAGAGHFPMYENPDDFYGELARFVGQ